MADHQVDCRGLACPKPVMMTRKALNEAPPGRVLVLVTQEVQSRNVAQLAKAAGFEVEVTRMSDHFRVTILKPEAAPAATPGLPLLDMPIEATAVEPEPALSPLAQVATVFLLTSDRLGEGNQDLGALLAELMVNTLPELDERPARLVLMNTGVRLACSGSKVLAALHKLEDQGVELLVCGTCLEFLGLLDELQAGHVSNMYDIVTALLGAASVVAL